jgi:transcription-repair coupling factor (superfamily II helicase)
MSQSQSDYLSPLDLRPQLPASGRVGWGRLYGSAQGLAIAEAARAASGPIMVVTQDAPAAMRLEQELLFYTGADERCPILNFPDWETLPYDHFSPHQEIISQRLTTLSRLGEMKQGVLIVPVTTLMLRVVPQDYLQAHSLLMDVGQTLDIEALARQLEASGYIRVSTVMEHGEFAVRGSIVDLFPMGSEAPYRVDLFDNEVETIRTFDPESQRTEEKVEAIRLLPAKEYPLDKAGIKRFREAYLEQFEGDPSRSLIYSDVIGGLTPSGLEYYFPLFFDDTATLFDYLPAGCLLFTVEDVENAAQHFWDDVAERYEQRRHDIERPLLPPERLYQQLDEVSRRFQDYPRIQLDRFEQPDQPGNHNFSTQAPPALNLDVHAGRPTKALQAYLADYRGRVLFAAESSGRREVLLELLKGCEIHPASFDTWRDFIGSEARIGITVAALENGCVLERDGISVIAEAQLFGPHAITRKRRRGKQRDADAIVRNLAELEVGAPVVHEDNGVGRYLGMQTLEVGGLTQEYLTLEYAGGDKLYVPVASLHLISRYSGAAPESAPLHKLGSGQWEKAKRKASERVRDVAAELLEIYARREARKGIPHSIDDQYRAFAASFPYEETPDQHDAIEAVLADMASDKPMDRLVCGDVGFGKTEVAIRAAFVAVQNGQQVAMLVPTTLLAQQHYQSFRDRFADWPVRIESISRFRSKKEQDAVLTGLESGGIDIVIGTHKLLQEGVKYKNLGLLIIDEEHRFGVRQKEQFKALRSEIDILSLTATPIPRTLNMAFAGMREFSVISTPPARRLPVKTFVAKWDGALIRESIQRELKRGGQVYFLHNEVETIEKMTRELSELVPEAKVEYAHGQMGERQLERVMSDFYHQRFNVLVCTTIIETGIDVPSANTIVINRADRFGLAQLYQLRGRVGRSHHRAYAYLVVPSKKAMTQDAVKRLEAIEAIEDLGTGFTLATHDLEIRGAGELLGEEQSGQMQAIGFTLYSELLERAVAALKAGKEPELERPLDHGAEIDIHAPALIPEDYLPDVHTRLVMYKRIASAENEEELRDLQVEMIDRFGLLPEPTKTLFAITELKLKARPIGIRKIDVGTENGRIVFTEQPDIDPMKIIQLIQNRPKRFKLDGNERLRFFWNMPGKEERLEVLNTVLAELDESRPAA